MQALVTNMKIDALFKFFRPNPSGDGTTEQFYTVEILMGRIDSIDILSPDVISPASTNAPPTEEVSFVFPKIRWRYERDGIEQEDDWEVPR